MAKSACEGIRLRMLTQELGFGSHEPTVIHCESQSAIKVTKDPMFHEKTKHFKTHWHFTRQKQEEGKIRVEFVPTIDQPADMFTKALGRTKSERLP